MINRRLHHSTVTRASSSSSDDGSGEGGHEGKPKFTERFEQSKEKVRVGRAERSKLECPHLNAHSNHHVYVTQASDVWDKTKETVAGATEAAKDAAVATKEKAKVPVHVYVNRLGGRPILKM